jgi:hypothetical protein
MMPISAKYEKEIAHIFESKDEFRKMRAQLPIEEKIKILVHLQEIANEAASATGRSSPGLVWPIETD